MGTETRIIPIEQISSTIHVIRKVKVMLDRDLAVLYGVQTRALVQAVKRNADRFPSDFMFQLTSQEVEALHSLRSQSVILENGPGKHSKYLPYAFTEEGVGMLSSVLRSPRAVAVNIEIIRAFVMLRRHALDHEELRQKIEVLARKYDRKLQGIFAALQKLIEPEQHKPTLGFARKKIS